MICSKCGSPQPDNIRFCSCCGTPVAAEPVETAIPSPAAEPVADSPVVTIAPPKKKKTGLKIFLAITAILVVLGLLFTCGLGTILGGIFLLTKEESHELERPNSSLSSTPTPPSAKPDTPVIPSNPPVVEKVNLVVTEAELVYEMTDGDVDYFYELLAQLKDSALGGADGDTVMELSEQLDDWYYYMDAQLSIAALLYYCDLSDEDASQLYLDCTDALTEAYKTYMEAVKELYAASFPAKDRFFEDWSEIDLARLEAYTPEISDLEQRNSEITIAYQAMQNDENMYTKMIPLYIELVQNNNRIAQYYGYDNYYEYAYERVYDRDYGSDEIEIMRNLAAQYLPEAADGAYNKFHTVFSNLSWAEQYALQDFMYSTYQNGYVDEMEGYFATLPYQACEDMLDMFNGNIILANNMRNAQEGAFTGMLGEDRCICFFGPGYDSTLTVMHEVGHYYGGMHTYLNDIPLDMAETQSQGNEWLFMSFLKDEMDSDFYNATVNYKLYTDIATILLCVIIDDFEESVYTHPDIANLTGEDLDAIMADVCVKYGGIDYLNDLITDVQGYWRNVVVEQPVYYISYGVSAIAAINVYTIASEDYEQAVGIYCSLVEGLDLEIGFLGNLEKAGLDGPFDEAVYNKLYQMVA